MREDMAKVVTEMPRRGSRWKNRKSRARVHRDHHDADDHGPSKLKMSHYGGSRGAIKKEERESKDFSDVIGPLRKYLRKQVGRPWDKVYSEMSANLDKRTMTGRHIWTNVWQYVEKNCHEGPGGKIYRTARRWVGYEVDGLYVHPRTGLLCYKPERRYRHERPKDADLIAIDKFTTLNRIDGIWHRVCYGVKDVYVPPVLRRDGSILRAESYREEFVQQSKKQLSRTELKAAGLHNAPVAQ